MYKDGAKMITSITAKNCETLIKKDRYEYDDMMKKLDVFLLKDRISLEEYNILVQMMDDKKVGEV